MCCNCSCTTVLEPIQIKVGSSSGPSNDTSIYTNNKLKYLKYLVFKNGFGYLIENEDFERLPNGGFKLLNSSLFITSEVYTLTFYK